MEAAAACFSTTADEGDRTGSRTGAGIEHVHGPLMTSVLLLRNGSRSVCLVSSDHSTTGVGLSLLLRERIAGELGLAVSQVLLFSTHNHSNVHLSKNSIAAWQPEDLRRNNNLSEDDLLPAGKQLLESAVRTVRDIGHRLEPVTVSWAQGREGRISYNRKGRRADGSTFFMREEDRVLYGDDFRGDIDSEAPIVVLKGASVRPVAVLIQFTAHPVTSFHAEHPVVFGDYPRAACDRVAEHFAENGEAPPVLFLQGCCGDINSKKMFVGGVDEARKYGLILAQTYIDASENLSESESPQLDLLTGVVRIPLARLPPVATLEREIGEMGDFITRAMNGDEDTLSCVGQNFPRALTPLYRAKLVEMVLPWNQWALEMHRSGQGDELPRFFEMEVYALRIGDVAIAGLPCEPFQGIGRQIREGSPFPLTISCGYANVSYGYITDSANTGDSEYMSAFYRYTRFRPPLRKPAGDKLAWTVLRAIRKMQ